MFSERITRILKISLRPTKLHLVLGICAINYSVCLNMFLLILHHSGLFLNNGFSSIISELEEYKLRKIACGRPGSVAFKESVRTASRLQKPIS